MCADRITMQSRIDPTNHLMVYSQPSDYSAALDALRRGSHLEDRWQCNDLQLGLSKDDLEIAFASQEYKPSPTVTKFIDSVRTFYANAHRQGFARYNLRRANAGKRLLEKPYVAVPSSLAKTDAEKLLSYHQAVARTALHYIVVQTFLAETNDKSNIQSSKRGIVRSWPGISGSRYQIWVRFGDRSWDKAGEPPDTVLKKLEQRAARLEKELSTQDVHIAVSIERDATQDGETEGLAQRVFAYKVTVHFLTDGRKTCAAEAAKVSHERDIIQSIASDPENRKDLLDAARSVSAQLAQRLTGYMYWDFFEHNDSFKPGISAVTQSLMLGMPLSERAVLEFMLEKYEQETGR